MKIETELKKLDAFYQNMEYQKIEPFLVEKIAEAKECESYDAYLAFSNELIGFYRIIHWLLQRMYYSLWKNLEWRRRYILALLC